MPAPYYNIFCDYFHIEVNNRCNVVATNNMCCSVCRHQSFVLAVTRTQIAYHNLML